jgi:hypothetical protein
MTKESCNKQASNFSKAELARANVGYSIGKIS